MVTEFRTEEGEVLFSYKTLKEGNNELFLVANKLSELYNVTEVTFYMKEGSLFRDFAEVREGNGEQVEKQTFTLKKKQNAKNTLSRNGKRKRKP